eukprot:10148593-Ditylum_brightwellii.AAC.1
MGMPIIGAISLINVLIGRTSIAAVDSAKSSASGFLYCCNGGYTAGALCYFKSSFKPRRLIMESIKA